MHDTQDHLARESAGPVTQTSNYDDAAQEKVETLPVVSYPHNVNVKLRISAELQRRQLDRSGGGKSMRTKTQYAKNRPKVNPFKTDLSLNQNLPNRNLCDLVATMQTASRNKTARGTNRFFRQPKTGGASCN